MAAFSVRATCGRARVGTLVDRIQTPNCLIYTRRGAPAHLTSDLLNHPSLGPYLKSTALHLPLPELVVHPGAAYLRQYPGGAHQFLQLEDQLLCVSTRDAVINDLGPANDASYSLSAFHGKFRLTPAQFMRATSSLRPDIIVALADECPSSVTAGRAKKSVNRSVSWLDQCLAIHRQPSTYRYPFASATDDEKVDDAVLAAAAANNNANAAESKQRHKKRKTTATPTSADADEKKSHDSDTGEKKGRTEKSSNGSSSGAESKGESKQPMTLLESLARVTGGKPLTPFASALTRQYPSATHERRPLLLAAIQGGCDDELRGDCATQMAARVDKGVDGFVLGGLETGESLAERLKLIEAMIKPLPSDRVRMATGQGAPEDVLHGVEQGIDMFDSPYPYLLTQLGLASTFPFDEATLEAATSAANATSVSSSSSSTSSSTSDAGVVTSGGSLSKMNLRDKRFAKDTSPILVGCKCATCTSHTRAYIHHLLNVHEMLAQVLLQQHNLHHYMRFFESIRTAILANKFTEFKAKVLATINK